MDKEVVESLRLGTVLILTSALLIIGLIVFMVARQYGGEFYDAQAETQRTINVAGLAGLSYSESKDIPVASLYTIVSREWRHVANVYIMGKECKWTLIKTRAAVKNSAGVMVDVGPADSKPGSTCSCLVGVVRVGCTCTDAELRANEQCICNFGGVADDAVFVPLTPHCDNLIVRGIAGRWDVAGVVGAGLVEAAAGVGRGWTLANGVADGLVELKSKTGQLITYVSGPEDVLYAKEPESYDNTLSGRAYVSVYQDDVTLGYNVFVRRLP